MKKIERFIVVDDDRTNNLLCEYILKKTFPSTVITLFTRPEYALQIITEEYGSATQPVNTVLLLDINMPRLTGWEFLVKFDKLPAEIRLQFNIFILSSSNDDRDKEKAEQNASVCGFLPKAFSIKTIKDLVESNCEEHEVVKYLQLPSL